VAVHGSSSIPNYPASHGCVRVSVPFMDFVWDQNLMPMGTTVWVHGG
jgi:lipoprotein-anchoring transpeptidase ErfK/SrfK